MGWYALAEDTSDIGYVGASYITVFGDNGEVLQTLPYDCGVMVGYEPTVMKPQPQSLHVSGDGSTLFATTSNQQPDQAPRVMFAWDTETWEPYSDSPGFLYPAYSGTYGVGARVSPDGSYVQHISDKYSTIARQSRVYRLSDWAVMLYCSGTYGGAFSGDGTRFAVPRYISEAWYIKVYDTATWGEVHSYALADADVVDICITHSGGTVYWVDWGSANLKRARVGVSEDITVAIAGSSIDALCVTADGSRLAALGSDTVYVYDLVDPNAASLPLISAISVPDAAYSYRADSFQPVPGSSLIWVRGAGFVDVVAGTVTPFVFPPEYDVNCITRFGAVSTPEPDAVFWTNFRNAREVLSE